MIIHAIKKMNIIIKRMLMIMMIIILISAIAVCPLIFSKPNPVGFFSLQVCLFGSVFTVAFDLFVAILSVHLDCKVNVSAHIEKRKKENILITLTIL